MKTESFDYLFYTTGETEFPFVAIAQTIEELQQLYKDQVCPDNADDFVESFEEFDWDIDDVYEEQFEIGYLTIERVQRRKPFVYNDIGLDGDGGDGDFGD